MLFDRNEMYTNERCYDNNIDMTTVNVEIDQNFNQQQPYMQQSTNMNYMENNCGCNTPIIECPVEKCVHREIFHEVPHVCPIHTKIINHHIYKHTYTPQYTCCEENEITNIDAGSCCNFR